jgi:hypothetical protein
MWFWKPITLHVNLRLRWSLKQSCSLCQKLSNRMWHATYTEGNWGDSWLLVVGCRNPTLAKCEDETHTPKVGDLESSGTPKFLEFDNKGQNTSPWGVLSVIGKVFKCRCPKWPRIGHLDICSPSYGQNKGRESNWQFDSWPLKVRNRPAPDVRWGNATRRWKALKEGYKFGLDLIPIGGRGEKLWYPKVLGVQNRDSFGTPLWESREKVPFGCKCDGKAQRIL